MNQAYANWLARRKTASHEGAANDNAKYPLHGEFAKMQAAYRAWKRRAERN